MDDKQETKTKFSSKKIVTLAVLVMFAAAAGLFVWQVQNKASNGGNPSLTQEELAKLVRPSVVRIINRITGEISIPQFKVNPRDLTVTLLDGKSEIFKVDEYLTGSGAIVSPQGHILTNAHVASEVSVQEIYAEAALRDKLMEMSEEEASWLLENEQGLAELVDKALAIISQSGSFRLESSLTVLNPATTMESVAALTKDGYQAEVIALNKNYRADEKDVAVLKIDADNLPSLLLGDSESASVGEKVFALGYPSTAEFNSKSVVESTFTQGVLSAIKFSKNKDFRVFQTDAKISRGSSGGPLLDGQGKVIGLITFLTSESKQDKGDSFAFAVPAHVAKVLLEDNGIKNEEGAYSTHLKKALLLMQARQCKAALQELSLSKNSSDFSADKFLNPYVEHCNKLISQGQSVDNLFQKIISWLKSVTGFSWFVVVGRLLLVALAVWALIEGIRRVRRDEDKLLQLTMELDEEKNTTKTLFEQLSKKGVDTPQPDEETHADARKELDIPHPHLFDYIHEARAVGLADAQIREELRKAGWKDDEIDRAITAR